MNTIPLNIYAASSLRYVFPALIETFQQQYDINVTTLFAPAGLLYEKIQQESNYPVAHLFASANSLYPQQLVEKKVAVNHTIFAHNSLCMTVRKQIKWTSRHWLDILLDPRTRIGMSTPKKDPSGDYTFSLFDTIESQYAGQGELLKQRAKQLVGGALQSSLPDGVRPANYFLLNNSIDVFIGYANYAPSITQIDQLALINIPTKYYQPINYSMALLAHKHRLSQQFITFLLSNDGQSGLKDYGFLNIA